MRVLTQVRRQTTDWFRREGGADVSARDATSIIGEVQAAVARGTDFADQAGVSDATRNQIARSLPTRAM
jgi:hypothetical protein